MSWTALLLWVGSQVAMAGSDGMDRVDAVRADASFRLPSFDETTDLAEDFAEVLAELSADWDQYALENGIAVFEEDIGYGRYASP